MNKLLELDNVCFSYTDPGSDKKKSRFELSDISFSIDEKDFVSIVGTNGSGKSTLVKLLSRILSGYSGKILYKGKNINSFNKKEYSRAVSYLPQSANTFNESLIVKDLLMLGRYAHKKFTDFKFSDEDKRIVEAGIAETGINKFANDKLYQLSGGEKQKVLLTLALVQLDITKDLKDKILIIDEPLTHLDVNYQFEIFSILKKLNAKGLTIIIVIHDLSLALNYTGKTILMNEGKIIRYSDSKNVITKEMIADYFKIKSEIVKYENSFLINYTS